MRRVESMAGVVAMLLVCQLTGCTSNAPSSSNRIMVFAAASLKTAFTEIGERFQTDNPGVGVEFSFAGSSVLATQLRQGATADVFAAADTAQMAAVAQAGLLADHPTNFASNTLVIVTAPGNPERIAGFADLAKPGLNVVVCQARVPCGSATRRVEDATGIHLNPISEELSVTDVLNKLTTGQADAALVYVTDAISAGKAVTTVKFTEASLAVNVYSIAVLKNARQAALAQEFLAIVTTETGLQILNQSGFGKP